MSHLLEVFYSVHCPSCPEARQAVRRFAYGRTDVVVVEHDAESTLELAKRYRLIATPALVVDGHSVIYGVPKPAAIVARIEVNRAAASVDEPTS